MRNDAGFAGVLEELAIIWSQDHRRPREARHISDIPGVGQALSILHDTRDSDLYGVEIGKHLKASERLSLLGRQVV